MQKTLCFWERAVQTLPLRDMYVLSEAEPDGKFPIKKTQTTLKLLFLNNIVFISLNFF